MTTILPSADLMMRAIAIHDIIQAQKAFQAFIQALEPASPAKVEGRFSSP
ncbi:MAG: hypothetical protein MUF49_30380 [Oculatellaceae cyanobacterium Prado106]|jgi:hypothetical protein|nr:hypothetical protein [Oculatellaceae cyanobacterium Prado106]